MELKYVVLRLRKAETSSIVASAFLLHEPDIDQAPNQAGQSLKLA